MMHIDSIREKIDIIDEQLVRLLCERMDCSKEIAKYKKENNLPVFNACREAVILDKVKALSKDEYKGEIEKTFIEIMSLSKELQKEIIG